jgi:hypothetical protein
MGRLAVLACALAAAWISTGCLADAKPGEKRLFIIGQDLSSVRGYYESACCPAPDGQTAYLDFYNLLSGEAGYGGLGIDLDGNPLQQDWDWGTGPANAWKSATEYPGGFAIGLSITENDHPGGLDRIAAGELDDNARQLARFIRLIERPVYLRIGYEFDGGWNHGYENAERYKTVFRRIVDVLREEGVENVEYVWQAAAFPLDVLMDGGYTDYREWYPGDDYVDWMGVSLFLGLDEVPTVETAFVPPTVRVLIERMLDFAREKGRPVMIAEASPQGYDLANNTNRNITPILDGPSGEGRVELEPEEIWNAWFGPVFEFMEEHRDVIRALAYINANWDAQAMWGPPYNSGYWGDTRLEANPYVAERFNESIERWRAMD